jgi:hypothetical protein
MRSQRVAGAKQRVTAPPRTDVQSRAFRRLAHHIISRRSGRSNVDNIEQEIKAKGLAAPRVTPASVEATILSEHYFTAGDAVEATAADEQVGVADISSLHLLTICVLVLRNGFTVTGESACASPDNFDADLGRRIARMHAVEKIWPLEGYALKTMLALGNEA